MIYKFALCEAKSINLDPQTNKLGLIKTASGKVFVEPNSDIAKIVEAEIKKHPTALFFRAKAIKADEPNSNGDYFSEEEILKSYKSFEGVPFFTNHDNQNIENARGKIIYAEWTPEEKAVYTIAFVDREAFPHICRSIEEEYVTGVSMGASIDYSICNICQNRAEKTEDYCFVPNTPVLMSDLSVKEIKDIKIGDEVIDAFGDITKVIKIFAHDVDEEMTIFYTKAIDGELISTNNHPYLTKRRGEWKFMPAEFLDDKETLFTPIPKIKYSDDFWTEIRSFGFIDTEENRLMISKLLGYYIAEGCLSRNNKKEDTGIELSLHSDEKEYLDEIIDISQKLFNKKPEIFDRNIYNHKTKSIRIFDDQLVKIINASCTGLAKNKILSKNVLALNQKYIRQILAGYIDGDGYSDDYGRVIITTASRQLASQIFYLLLSLRVGSSINSYLQNGGPLNRDDISYKIYRIQIASKQLEAIKDCGFKCSRSYKIAKNRCDQNKAQNSFSEEGMMKYNIFGLGNIYYKGTVYNIETESHSYVANNTSVHNCSHIKNRKGRKFSGKAKNVVTGEIKEFKDELVFEYNYGIKFIELSAVVDPACPSCRIQGLIKNDDYMKKVANIQNQLYMIKEAAIEKEAGQEEVNQLKEVFKTLESIAIQLIQNRQQIEVEFASDLVGILSDLQKFVDELVGAGYGNLQSTSQGIPGVMDQPPSTPGNDIDGLSPTPAPAPGVPGLPPPTPAGNIAPVSAETSLPAGNISGSPTKPLVQLPQLPITAPSKPRASTEDSFLKVSSSLNNFIKKIAKTEDDCMAKRRTIGEKSEQKKNVTKILSNSWKEKQIFFEYINKVPSIQNNLDKLSVKKRDDTFVIVAENKKDSSKNLVWTYENLNNREKELVKKSPQDAALYFLNAFSNLNKKEGESIMSNMKEAGARTVNQSPEVVTEAQLDNRDLYHARTDESKDIITEKQLEGKRSGEKEVITEAQLNEKSNKLNPRTDDVPETVTEEQLDSDRSGASPRQDDPKDQITQVQLEEHRVTEKDVITEKQLDSSDAPWKRAAKRNSSMFKSAGDHMRAVVDVMADTVMATGCTPTELLKISSSMVDSIKGKYELANAIQEPASSEKINYTNRLAFWKSKNIKVAGVDSSSIADSFVTGLRLLASDLTINPEVVIDAIDVVVEDNNGSDIISKKVDEKMTLAKSDVYVSRKDELKKALRIDNNKEVREDERKEVEKVVANTGKKVNREAERAMWEKAVDNKISQKADRMIETSFDEVGCTKEDPNFRSTIKGFARAALASKDLKLAAITNVTINGDTISIAVQTNDGDEAVEIPVGESTGPEVSEEVPEGDMSGEGLENTLPPLPSSSQPVSPTANEGLTGASGLSPATGLPMTASSKKMTKKAQTPGGAGGIAGSPSAPAMGAPEAGGLPGAVPAGDPVQALTTDAPAEDTEGIKDEIPTAGTQQMPWTICPECGSSDVDVNNNEETGDIEGNCNACGAKYTALLEKNVKFKIIKPTKSVGEDGSTGTPEVPEVPALPVAAQTRLDKGTIVRIASNKDKFGYVCPACGMNQCKASVEKEGHIEYTCPACNTDVQRDIMVNVNNPEDSYLRVKWDAIPPTDGCDGCKKEAKKFVSVIKVAKMLKNASDNSDKFPMANCLELAAKRYGGNSTATQGPCKGKALAKCLCEQLQKLGLTKVRHLEKLAKVSTQPDPMDECIKDQIEQKKLSKKEAETVCGCLKKKFATASDNNILIQAFADDIASGTETMFSEEDLGPMNDAIAPEEVSAEDVNIEEDIDIADVQETVDLEVSKETAQELADAASVAVTKEEPVEEVDVNVEETSNEIPAEVPAESNTDITNQEEINMSVANMQSNKLKRVGNDVIKVAEKPQKVETIEKNVDAGVPRGQATIGKEGNDNIDKPMASPKVPRGKATMGKEGPDNIDKPMDLPDVAKDSSYMGQEGKIQGNMPAINNEIKGTVIAEKQSEEIKKEAKKMKEVETVEKDVDAGVPRAKATMGKEGPDNVDVKEDKPDVPRAKATMGQEGSDNIDVKTDSPDVPIDSAYMGKEKEIQKDMPPVNDEYLKLVQQKKDVQLERIAGARKIKAIETAAKLLATGRISETAYENVIEALSKFEIDKIVSVADNMYPRIQKTASAVSNKEVHAGTAIVLESKDIVSKENDGDTLQKKISSYFTIGNREFDNNLTRFNEK